MEPILNKIGSWTCVRQGVIFWNFGLIVYILANDCW